MLSAFSSNRESRCQHLAFTELGLLDALAPGLRFRTSGYLGPKHLLDQNLYSDCSAFETDDFLHGLISCKVQADAAALREWYMLGSGAVHAVEVSSAGSCPERLSNR